ncbi:MAG: hypothetical protein O2887_08975 [Bacteroidetes bacterium]|nr:hypothetical protein [Bacteroidota bacterium]MDA1120606.1 hypothetical protein [Bacteroidota bacterium]
MRIFAITILLSVSQLSLAQTNCACCTDYHKQFDFWVGDWIVNDTTGIKVGENLIVKLEDDCIINEHWEGAGGSTGRSYNYFNLSDSTWNQVWIDNSGSNLVLKGKAKENQMILKSELIKGTRVDWYRNKITWTKNNDGTVTQFWEILDKNDNLLSVAFKGIYIRK